MASGDCLLPDITLDLLDSADFSVSLGVLAAANLLSGLWSRRASLSNPVCWHWPRVFAAWLWSSVLDDHKCGGGSRGVMTTSVSTLDLSSHPGAASASLLSRGGDLDILCRFLEAFRFVGGGDYNPLLFGGGGLEVCIASALKYLLGKVLDSTTSLVRQVLHSQ